MRKERNTVGSLALEQGPRVIAIPPVSQEQTRKLRVAAYARVSSDSEDQLHSFAAQTTHYTELIHQNPDWEFVDVYADKGITGTSAEKRDDFQRLLADCRRGRIDKILVKSSSRFARNAKESLEAVRELKALGIAVCFEEDKIDTSKLSGELLTAIFAMLAQKESEAISERMRWSYQVRMKAGKFITCNAPLGYDLVDGKLEINENEAEVVRHIFQQYLSGQSLESIAKDLTRYGVPTRAGGPCWGMTAVGYILSNEKYVGDSLLQKSYTTKTLPHRIVKNNGKYPQYYMQNSHPAIIERNTFEMVQNLLERRREALHPQSQGKYVFTGKIICQTCGSTFKRKSIDGTSVCWICQTHNRYPERCQTARLPEQQIKAAFLCMYYKLRHQGINILKQLLKDLQAAREARMLWSMDIVKLNDRIADIISQDRLLAQLKQQGLVDPDLFISRRDRLAEQLRTAKLEKERLLEAEEDQTIQQTLAIMDALKSGPDLLAEFDEELFSELVEKIIVEKEGRLRFHLINGLQLTEQIERTVR